VKRWRERGWEGAENVTKDLLRHWCRKDRSRRFFFCQLEAAETIIFLNEIRGLRKDGSRGKPRWTPEFTDTDFETLLDRPFDPGYAPLCRMACKMATGSGKTVVMAMLITWTFCNRGRVPSDERFPNAVLVCCPNLTIKERLQVLRTDARGDDYYTQFDLVPPQYRDLLRTGKVMVTNWHFFTPESEHSEGGKSYTVVKKGEETDDVFARNRLGELFERGPIMVLNDEGPCPGAAALQPEAETGSCVGTGARRPRSTGRRIQEVLRGHSAGERHGAQGAACPDSGMRQHRHCPGLL
jgi:type III restriction enzyme